VLGVLYGLSRGLHLTLGLIAALDGCTISKWEIPIEVLPR
jgi:hypothetical protein